MSDKNTTPVVATKRINGEIEPGTIICPETIAELEELRSLNAVQDCSEADLALYEQQQQASVAPPKKVELKAAAAEEAAAAEAKAAEAKAAEAKAAEEAGLNIG